MVLSYCFPNNTLDKTKVKEARMFTTILDSAKTLAPLWSSLAEVGNGDNFKFIMRVHIKDKH
jgi:hypothetical protein